jgi:site-specific DNA recombinase
LNGEAVALRARLDGLAVSWADGALTDSQLRTMTERLRQRLGEVEARMTASSRAPVLAGLAGAADVAAKWAALPLDRRRAVVDALMTVTILPTGRGRGFDRDSVRVEQKG